MRVKDLLEILENADPEADVFAVFCLGNDDELHVGIKDVEDLDYAVLIEANHLYIKEKENEAEFN